MEVKAVATSRALQKARDTALAEDVKESRGMVLATAGAYTFLGGGLVLLIAALSWTAPGFATKLALLGVGISLGLSSFLAAWPRSRIMAARFRRTPCPECGVTYQVTAAMLESERGGFRVSRVRSPSGHACVELLCEDCGTGHRFRRSGQLVGVISWRRDESNAGAAVEAARAFIQSLGAVVPTGAVVADLAFFEGELLPRGPFIEHALRSKSFEDDERLIVDVVGHEWTNLPDGVPFLAYLEERVYLRDGGGAPFDCEDYLTASLLVRRGERRWFERVSVGLFYGEWLVVGYQPTVPPDVSDALRGELSLAPLEGGDLSLPPPSAPDS